MRASNAPAIEARLNELGRKRIPFFVAIDFDMNEYYISPLDTLSDDIRFSFGSSTPKSASPIAYRAEPPEYQRYLRAFEEVQEEIRSGNSYLLNLTLPSRLHCDAGLEAIYEAADAPFKLLFRDRFVCFSPERFVRIAEGRIETHPMKGTIDASWPDAKRRILADPKERAEHIMVVDLLRNDLNLVATGVRVERFRYVELLRTGRRELLQVSSQITGELGAQWHERIGSILTALLPAGSITGTPKRSTVEIIRRVEGYDRGFFTGVFGLFDGESFDSAVMIRFIEKRGDELWYKSGGGITIDSDPLAEYRELQEKVYVPVL